MKTQLLFWGGNGIGFALCVAAFLRILYVQAAWKKTTFHPSSDLDTPALLFCLGAIFITVSVLMAIFDWAKDRRSRQGSDGGPR